MPARSETIEIASRDGHRKSALHALLAGDRLLTALPGSGIAPSALPTDGKTPPMTIASIGPDVLEALDVLANLAAQGTFDDETRVEKCIDRREFLVVEFLREPIGINPGPLTNVRCVLRADAVNVLQRIEDLLTFRDVDACETWHAVAPNIERERRVSALPLLESGILLIDHEPLSFADHDLTVFSASFDTASNLHGWFLLYGFELLVAIRNSTLGQVVWTQFDGDPVAGEDADEKFPHFSADVGEELLSVFKPNLESGVGQCFHDFCVERDFILFGHMKGSFLGVFARESEL
jgi:hypothetical protein